jgi:hypothetical protein
MKYQSGFPHNFLLKRTSVFMLLVLLAVLTLLSGFRKDSRKPLKNYILLVSLDGFRWDYCKLYNTPNLNRLAKDGVKAERMDSLMGVLRVKRIVFFTWVIRGILKGC